MPVKVGEYYVYSATVFVGNIVLVTCVRGGSIYGLLPATIYTDKEYLLAINEKTFLKITNKLSSPGGTSVQLPEV